MNEEIKTMFNAIVEEMGKMETRITNQMNERFSKIDTQLLSIKAHEPINKDSYIFM